MPSPFPGMDPYLEEPSLWPNLHHSLITYSRAALNAALPSHYVATIEERVYIMPYERSVIPDVNIHSRFTPLVPRPPGRGGVAIAEPFDPPLIVRLQPQEVHEGYIEIRKVDDKLRVVTTIEVLSPSNKVPNSQGGQKYLRKQKEVLSSPTHLVEIDLLRTGAHTVAIPYDQLPLQKKWDYLVCLHRGGQDNEWDEDVFEVWENSVREPLPRICIPLDSGDPDVILDLQAVFHRCYAEGAYERLVDYSQPINPPLREEDAAWAMSLTTGRK